MLAKLRVKENWKEREGGGEKIIKFEKRKIQKRRQELLFFLFFSFSFLFFSLSKIQNCFLSPNFFLCGVSLPVSTPNFALSCDHISASFSLLPRQRKIDGCYDIRVAWVDRRLRRGCLSRCTLF